MVQIKRWEEIDETKLRELFKKRGHGILNDNFLDQVKDILEGKYPELEVHQCECGELMFLSHERAEALKKRYNSTSVPCKACKGYGEEMLNLQFLERFSEITEFIDERDEFVTRTEQNMKQKDVETLADMALGLFPTNTHAEMLVGYYDFMQILFSHFPGISYTPMPEVKKLLDDALKINAKDFENLYLSVCDWKKSHQATMNIYSKEDMLKVLQSQDSTKSLKDNLLSTKKVKTEKMEIQLQLSTYQDMIEIDVYLDFLLNVLNIVEGRGILENPFSAVVIPPSKANRKPRKINSLADKVEYLQLNLPFDIKSIYNTHLRNAIAHNELEIRVNEKLLLLTKYSEELTFEEFYKTFNDLQHLQGSIGSYLADYQIAKTRLKVINQGLAAAVLGYTDFFEEEGTLHPKSPCDAQLNLYQYWDFSTFDKGLRVFPKYEIKLNKNDKNLTLDFGENGALFVFLNDSQLIEWLQQVIITGRIHVVLYTVAPILPFFSEKAIMRCSIGKKTDLYTIAIDEKTSDASDSLMKSILKFLN
jgi:hypothetical protein